MIRILNLLILSLILSSCIHQEPPALRVPQQWPVHNSQYINSTQNLAYFAWWQQFKDPGLNTLVDEGLIHNNEIKIALAHIDAAQGELKAVQLNWIPDLTGNAGYSSFPYLGYPGVLLTAIPTYTLNIFKQIKEQQQAKYELKVTQAMYQGIRLAIIGQIASHYFNYLGQIERLELLNALEHDLGQFIKISQAMYQGGLYPKTNLELAKTERSLVQAKKRMIQQHIVASENALHYLLDENPGQFATKSHFRDLNSQHPIIGALPFNIIENRPDMMQAREELAAAHAGIGIEFSHLLPTINLAMARGEIAKVPNGWQLGQAIHFNQAIAEVPFLRASTYGKLLKAKGLNKAAFYHYTDTLRKVLRDVSNDLSAQELYTKRLKEVLQAKNELHNAYRLNQKLHQRGIISHLSLVKEKITLDKLAIELNQSKMEQLNTIITLYQDLAAGYNYVPTPVLPINSAPKR